MKCKLCKSDLIDKLITHTILINDSPLIIEKTPAKICTRCGGKFINSEILNIIKNHKPEKYINVPIFNCSELKTEPLNNSENNYIFDINLDVTSLKNIIKGEKEVPLWIKGGKEINKLNHPNKKIKKELNRLFLSSDIIDDPEGGYIIYEIKKDEEGRKKELPLARIIYNNSQDIWELYWIWRSGIWQKYGTYNELNDVIKKIKEDKLCFCA